MEESHESALANEPQAGRVAGLTELRSSEGALGAPDDSWPWPHFPRGAKRNHGYDRSKGEHLTGWEGDFLHTLRETGIVRVAAAAARVSPRTVLNRRTSDPDFAQAYSEAIDDAVETLEAVAWQRARDGVTREKPIFYGGKQVGTEKVTEHSDGLLMFLLKANRPDKYRERIDHKHQVELMEAEARRIAEQQGLDPDELIAEARRIMGL